MTSLTLIILISEMLKFSKSISLLKEESSMKESLIKNLLGYSIFQHGVFKIK